MRIGDLTILITVVASARKVYSAILETTYFKSVECEAQFDFSLTVDS